MKYALIASLLAASTLTTACVKTNPAKTKVYVPGGSSVEYHCPPGQRKKGRC